MAMPADTTTSPTHCRPVGTSSRKIHPSRAICSSIVLLITADSPAPRRRSERFHSVKASAVLTTASQAMITTARIDSATNPSTTNPVPSRSTAPNAIETVVVTSGEV